MRTPNNPLADILMRAGLISPSQLEQVFQEQQRWGGRLIPLLVEMGLIQETRLVQMLSQEMRLSVATLDGMRQIPPEALRRVPVALCERYDVIPIGYDGRHNRLQVAMSDPTEQVVLQEVRTVSNSEIDPYVAGVTSIRRAIRIYFYGESTAEVLRVVPDLHPEAFGGYKNPPPAMSHGDLSGPIPSVPSGQWTGPSIPTTNYQHPPPRKGSYPPERPPNSRDSYDARGAANKSFGSRPPERSGVPTGPRPTTPESEHIAGLERKVDILEREIHKLRNTFNQLEDKFEDEIQEVQQLLRNRFQEQRMLVRGLLDLLVANGHLRKEDIVNMLNQIAQNQANKS
tara:strand:+ start:15388 stop:16413 length:1026 start_codon:yes stop_codon:yes gene_type:complete